MANPEALSMLRIARRDLKAAQVLQDNAIDEAIWGFQIHLGEDPPLIHNLTVLLERIAAAGADAEPFCCLRPSRSSRCSSAMTPTPIRWAWIVPIGCNVPSS